ncbi:hypothetical protein BKA66DRAFT_515471 [Pyrenochaeta sp. MPI-SDFR-AT-0127]|nr:hypothetical protein BKA66DRAFT_515471 [Pyrenochaeta sp. MPI-SDFR-AT-0127]
MPTPWITRSALLLLVTAVASCIPTGPGKPLQKRQFNAGVVSGVSSRDGNGNPFLRLDVWDLKDNHPDQWNLYVLALESLQSTDQSDPLSYYGLASIHGRPYKTWGDSPGLPDKIGTSGYCPHTNQLFLGWHRPYLALYEEVLHKKMQDIARSASSDQADRWAAAADAFRIPYWDWGQGEKGGPVPGFFMTPTIKVTKPDGSEATIANPLHSYRFHELVPGDFDDKWASMNSTIRWPLNSEPDAPSRQEMFASSYESQKRNLFNEVSRIFGLSTFGKFATRIEEPHGWIHGVVGGGWDAATGGKGHFWPLQYSAFEPLFMLHHTNVDRLFAIYQAAHPDRRMESSNIGSNGNVFLENGQTIDENTQLLPFKKSSGDFWTTKDCWDHTVLGYAYPETQRWKYGSDEDYRESVVKVISKLYGGSEKGQLSSQQVTADAQALLTKDGTFTDWTIQTQASPSGLPSTFVVHFSLVGDFSSDPSIDVGTWMILNPTDHTLEVKHMAARDSTIEQKYEGTISLTAHLLDEAATGRLASLDAKDVVPYLKDKLAWKVYSGEGTLIPQANLAALTIEVISSGARMPDDDPNAGIYYDGRVTAHPEITLGKSGGVTD